MSKKRKNYSQKLLKSVVVRMAEERVSYPINHTLFSVRREAEFTALVRFIKDFILQQFDYNNRMALVWPVLRNVELTTGGLIAPVEGPPLVLPPDEIIDQPQHGSVESGIDTTFTMADRARIDFANRVEVILTSRLPLIENLEMRSLQLTILLGQLGIVVDVLRGWGYYFG